MGCGASFFPKGTDLSAYDQNALDSITDFGGQPTQADAGLGQPPLSGLPEIHARLAGKGSTTIH